MRTMVCCFESMSFLIKSGLPPPVVPVATTGICYVFNVYVLFTKKETGFMFFMLSNMLVYGLLTEEIGWAI